MNMGKTKIMESGINLVVLQGLIQTSLLQCVWEGGTTRRGVKGPCGSGGRKTN